MFPANGQNLKLGRGSLLFAPHDGTVAEAGYIFVGNVPSLEFSWDIETREKYSATQRSSPLLASSTSRQDLTLVAQCDEHTKENLKRFFFATETTANQTLSTTGSTPVNDLVTGRSYDIGGISVTNVVVKKGSTVLVAGTDYDLYATQGMLMFKDSAAISDGDDVVIEYDRPLVNIDRLAIGRVSEQLCKILYIADDANTSGASAQDRYVLHKCSITPDGAYQLISDDYTSFNLRFKVLNDPANPNNPLGYFERRRVA
jgi:hypothetical protein